MLSWLRDLLKKKSITLRPLKKSKYSLSKRSLSSLSGVDEDLVKVVKRAIQITEQDFVVIEGLRTLARQKTLLAAGFSTTLRSKHIVGRAVDLIPYPVPGDWDQYTKLQWNTIAKAMKQAAKELNVDLQWGGDWTSFKDKPHWELKGA